MRRKGRCLVVRSGMRRLVEDEEEREKLRGGGAKTARAPVSLLTVGRSSPLVRMWRTRERYCCSSCCSDGGGVWCFSSSSSPSSLSKLVSGVSSPSSTPVTPSSSSFPCPSPLPSPSEGELGSKLEVGDEDSAELDKGKWNAHRGQIRGWRGGGDMLLAKKRCCRGKRERRGG
jgi:hypothetical protein